ncbi:MAG: thiol-disulfide oxidoreductase DCC family protein [Phycisphaerales bacterium]
MPDSPKDTLYYDGACGMCTRTTGILGKLDWLSRLEFRDMTKVPHEELPVPMEQAMLGIPMRTRSGRSMVGFPAVRRALLQTPLGCLPALFLYIPGISHLARAQYDRIARNRARSGACSVSSAGGAQSSSSSS